VISDLLLFFVIGFVAQIVDGAIGMAYGLLSTAMLLSFGVPLATASASVHAAEVFTTGASALSHWRLGNVTWGLFVRLAPAGMIGGGLGAYVLTAAGYYAAPGQSLSGCHGRGDPVEGIATLDPRRQGTPHTGGGAWAVRRLSRCRRRRRMGARWLPRRWSERARRHDLRSVRRTLRSSSSP